MGDSFLAIEIGGSKLQIAAGDGTGKILDRRRFAIEAGRGAALLREQIARVLPEITQQFRPAACGVGFGGPVDWKTGHICCSHHVEGWSNFALAEWLGAATDCPVRVDNDANVAALGESVAGGGLGFNPVFYVTLGSGVGGGLVADGRIYHGATPGESEIGHVRLDRSGATVESRCSGWAVDAKMRAAKLRDPAGWISRLVGSATSGEAKHLLRAVNEGDRTALAILDETADDLAFGLSHVVHLFHPQIVILGGGLSMVGEPLRSAVERALARFIMDAFAPGPEVRLASLGEDAVPVGALHLAMQAARA